MKYLARGIWGADTPLQATSEHRSVDECGLASEFNAAYRRTRAEASPRHLNEDDVAEIILRCRLLRSIDAREARRLLIAMEHAVDAVLLRVRPSMMLSLTIDSYVMDLFARLCDKLGIRFIGLVPSFLKDHFRLTVRGEYVDSREVSEAEIDVALASLIIKDYRPDFLVRSAQEMHQQRWRLWLRNFPKPLWFALRRMKPGDALNYHFWASQIVAKKYWSFWPCELDGVSGPTLATLSTDSGLPLIYIPLQMSPEATIDYWSKDTRWINYESSIIELVRRYCKRWRFLIKEHPNLLGYRSRGFYELLRAEPNCILVSPNVPSNDLVSVSQGVLVCTGTAGFEAALRGKPSLSDSEPYYAEPGVLLPIKALDDVLPPAVVDTERQRKLMAHVLRGTLRGRFLNNGTWSVSNPEHRSWSETMAASIRSYLKNADQLGDQSQYEDATFPK
jgi:hypothetical protein